MLHKKYKLSLLSLALISAFTYAEEQLEEIQVSANSSAEQSQQGFNTSVVSAKEIAKQPVVNDIAELVRMQPGVNFTSGNSNVLMAKNAKLIFVLWGQKIRLF